MISMSSGLGILMIPFAMHRGMKQQICERKVIDLSTSP